MIMHPPSRPPALNRSYIFSRLLDISGSSTGTGASASSSETASLSIEPPKGGGERVRFQIEYSLFEATPGYRPLARYTVVQYLDTLGRGYVQKL